MKDFLEYLQKYCFPWIIVGFVGSAFIWLVFLIDIFVVGRLWRLAMPWTLLRLLIEIVVAYFALLKGLEALARKR